MYNQQNNVQSVLKQFINGPSMNPYSLMSGGTNPLSTTSNINNSSAFQNLSASPERKNKKKVPEPAINNFNSTQNASVSESISLVNQAKEEAPPTQTSIATGVETSPDKPFRKSTIFNHLQANQQNQKMN